MRLVTLLSLLLFIRFCLAQQSEENFYVSKKVNLEIAIPDTLMFDKDYCFPVSGGDINDFLVSQFTGATRWWKNGNSFCLHTSDQRERMGLGLTLINKKDGQEAFSKYAYIFPNPLYPPEQEMAVLFAIATPKVFWGDQSLDSINRLSLKTLIGIKTLRVFANQNSTRYKVLSFSFRIIKDGKTESLNSSNANFTSAMKKALQSLNNGDRIVLSGVKYARADFLGDYSYAGPFKIIVTE